MTFQKVDVLPGFNEADFPKLQKIDNDTKQVVDVRTFSKDANVAASILVTACARAGKWKAVEISEFDQMLNEPIFALAKIQQYVVTSRIFDLRDQGWLKLFDVGGICYVVVTKAFARKCIHGS